MADSKYRFELREIVRFEDEQFGTGTGFVVGYCADADVYMVYPKVEHDWDDYPFIVLPIKSKNLVSTPF